jgi:hypothetical protein
MNSVIWQNNNLLPIIVGMGKFLLTKAYRKYLWARIVFTRPRVNYEFTA